MDNLSFKYNIYLVYPILLYIGTTRPKQQNTLLFDMQYTLRDENDKVLLLIYY